jgi:hypothetical protein
MEAQSLLFEVKPLRWGGTQMELAVKGAPGVQKKTPDKRIGIGTRI